MQKYSVHEWEIHGVHLFGREKRYWYFQCPSCHGIQSVEEVLKEGYPPDKAYSQCKSCHYESKKGTFGKGMIIQLGKHDKVEIFDFA